MRKRTERDLEIKCQRLARAKGIAALKIEKNGNAGVPDTLFVASGGNVLFVEFKRPDGLGNASREQLFWISFLGGAVSVIDNVEDFKKVFEKHFGISLE